MLNLKSEKRQIRKKINDTLDQYCEKCTIKTDNIKSIGVTDAMKYCMEQCERGIQIRKLGMLLDNAG